MEMKTALLSPKEARWHLPDRDTGLTARPASHPATHRELDGPKRSALRGGAHRPVRAWGAPKHQPQPARPVPTPGRAAPVQLRAPEGARTAAAYPGHRPRSGDADASSPRAEKPPGAKSPATPPGPPGPAPPPLCCPSGRGGGAWGVRRSRSGLAPVGPRGVTAARPGQAHPHRARRALPALPRRRGKFPVAPRTPRPPQSPGRRHLLPARRSSRGRRDEPAPRGPRVDSPGGCRRPRGGRNPAAGAPRVPSSALLLRQRRRLLGCGMGTRRHRRRPPLAAGRRGAGGRRPERAA